MARRLRDDAPPPRRLVGELALLGGGALLITSSIIQLLLWSDSYRDVEPLGQVLVLLGVLGILLALPVVRYGSLGLVLAGALYLAITTGLLLLVSGLELLGYQDGLPAPYTARSIAVPIVGLVLLAAVSWLISPPSRKPGAEPVPAPEAASGDQPTGEPAESALEPAAPVARPPGSVERIRWPAERPHPMRLATEPAAEPPAPAALEEPALAEEAGLEAAPAALVEPALAEEAGPEPAPAALEEPALAEEAGPEPGPEKPATGDEVASEPAAETEVAAEPEPQVAEAIAEHPTLQVEAQPAEAAAPEPAGGLSPELEAVPEWITDPLRSQLAREQDILERLQRALGPDDPGTLTTRSNIAAFYLAAGDISRAASLQEGIAADSVRILGATHPHTRTAQTKAAEWRKMAKKRRKPKMPVSR
jgi:hypothetical protein